MYHHIWSPVIIISFKPERKQPYSKMRTFNTVARHSILRQQKSRNYTLLRKRISSRNGDILLSDLNSPTGIWEHASQFTSARHPLRRDAPHKIKIART